jgi:hypothetical protein
MFSIRKSILIFCGCFLLSCSSRESTFVIEYDDETNQPIQTYSVIEGSLDHDVTNGILTFKTTAREKKSLSGTFEIVR